MSASLWAEINLGDKRELAGQMEHSFVDFGYMVATEQTAAG